MSPRFGSGGEREREPADALSRWPARLLWALDGSAFQHAFSIIYPVAFEYFVDGFCAEFPSATRETIEEAVQEGFKYAWKDGRERPARCIRVRANTLIRRRIGRDGRLAEAEMDSLPGSDTRAAQTMRDELVRLQLALARLSSNERSALVEAKLEERACKDIAKRHGWTVAKVKVLVHRGMAKLRKYFEQNP